MVILSVMPQLIVDPGGAKEQIHEIGDKISIGRTADNDVFVDPPSLSRRHARLELSGDRLLLIDLDSKNGVCLNGTVANQLALVIEVAAARARAKG